jgi:hypothetical protein
MRFTHYLALGDSISIDLYPSLDASHERESHRRVGAASRFAELLRVYHNRDLTFTNMTADGATIHQILMQATKSTRHSEHGEGLLITVTAGGNDISFSAMHGELNTGRICTNWDLLVADLLSRFPKATVIVNTLYDPTEGTGTFGGEEVAGQWERIAEQYSYGRQHLSFHIADAVLNSKIPNLLLADVRALFKGHGVTAPVEDQWYYDKFMIEPNYKGAAQIAELWLGTLHEAAERTGVTVLQPSFSS